ncbi:MAG: hypothetical protein IID33_14955, partial [Planctomycetes bacterium]|nr:hypothetical protein [Planctomycetota bacterium]
MIHYVTINWWSTGKLDLDWLSAPIAYAAMLLGVPLMTALILPLFTPTLAKFRIRDDQIARCMSYAYAGAAWTALFLAAAGVSEYTRFVIIGTYTDDWWGFLSDASQTLAGLSLAAAALGCELTLPGVSQSLVLTRTAVRSSDMPEGETLAAYGATGATLAIHLSINNLARVVRELTPHYGADCPAAVVYRASWPDEIVIRGRLDDIRAKVKAAAITRTALILV